MTTNAQRKYLLESLTRTVVRLKKQQQRWSSAKKASLAATVLNHPRSSKLDRMLAGCVLSQRAKEPRRTSQLLAVLAAAVLRSKRSTHLGKQLAGSVLSQRAPVAGLA